MGASYSLQVPSNEAYSLIALDWTLQSSSSTAVSQTFLDWVELSQPAVTGATATANLDLTTGAKLTPVDVTGQMDLPGGAKGPMAGAFGYWGVTTLESGESAFLGAPQTVGPTSDGSGIQWQGQYVPLAGTTPFTSYSISLADGSIVGSNVKGYPTDGEHITGLPVPPVVASTASLKLAQAASFSSGLSPRLWTRLEISGEPSPATTRIVWEVYTSGSATSVKAPALPTGVDAAQALGQNVTAQIVQCSSQDNGPTAPCDVFAYSSTLDVSP